jgi:hypothetical protein
MKIAIQFANKRDGCTMALFSKPKRKFRLDRLLDRALNRLEQLQRRCKGQPLPPRLDLRVS